jgi:hypothetical protein
VIARCRACISVEVRQGEHSTCFHVGVIACCRAVRLEARQAEQSTRVHVRVEVRQGECISVEARQKEQHVRICECRDQKELYTCLICESIQFCRADRGVKSYISDKVEVNK